MIALAVVVYGLGVCALALLEQRGLTDGPAGTVRHWLWMHAWLPGARIVCVMAFVACAWPALYGLDSTRDFVSLIGTGHRLGDWFNALFLAGLLLPLLPGAQRVTEFVLPLQGALAVAMVFRWAAIDATGTAPPVWPDAATASFALLWALFNRLLAAALHRFDLTGHGHWLLDALLLWMQLPVLIVYGLQLGESLS